MSVVEGDESCLVEIMRDLKDKYSELFSATALPPAAAAAASSAVGETYTGEKLNGKPHGKGRQFVLGEAGYIYEGTFLGGERSGAFGICVYGNGDVYRGAWLHDKRHGLGDLQLEKNSTTTRHYRQMGDPHLVVYKGSFENDMPKGIGELKYTDGSNYIGECEGFWRHGEGEHRTAKGEVFTGTFRYNRRHGKGILYTHFGEYKGVWRDDVLEDHVIFQAKKNMATPAGMVFYDGPCVGGRMTGTGAVVHFLDGSIYTGEVLLGKPNGKGVLEVKSLTISGIGEVMLRYEGDFVAGVPKGCGVGMFTIVSSIPHPTQTPLPLPRIQGFFPSFDVPGQYTGVWDKFLPSGNGEWVWENGQRYQGDVKSGLPHGSGILTGPEIQYEGSFSLGFPEGQGKMTWKDSHGNENRYEGTWKEGYFDGEGALTPHDTPSYVGAWKRGLREGSGVECMPKKYSYTGEFKDDKRHGVGKLYLEAENVMYEGDFLLGEMTGKGTMTLDDWTVINGEFLNGKPHGSVEMNLPNGRAFQGEFNNGVVSGCGTMMYSNGDKFQGSFTSSNGFVPIRHGRGVHHYFEGGTLECCWERDVLNGRGVYTTVTGDQSICIYVDGVRLKASSSRTNAPASDPDSIDAAPASSAGLQKSCGTQRLSVSVRQSPPRRDSCDKCAPHLHRQGRFRSSDVRNLISLVSVDNLSTPRWDNGCSRTQRGLSQTSPLLNERDASTAGMVVVYSSPMCVVRRMGDASFADKNKSAECAK